MFKKSIAAFAMIATLATTATIALPTDEAQAGSGGAFVAGAITGIAAGAIASHAHARNYGYGYAPRYRYPRPGVYHYGRPAPWSPAWYSYCSSRYRSFNPRTGYYMSYSGSYRFCR
ncbi:BA14K family protein [uncultured Cohaesibacter sp.]|uniref:BA14K family protein n=1 Tax=uncultured Cohaesibacter sp. TaxID=1002546 RepID=UPI0029300942|nr:BA14K family protein [uncultured Cohaesibacter sp.]